MSENNVTPYGKGAGKKQEVAEMFDNIAGNYDFLNHLLSMGIDVLWRKKAVRLIKPFQPKTIVDIATGTGDFALEALSLNPDKITGVDISNQMLEVGRQKMKKRKVDHRIEMLYGDSENLPFNDNHFDALTVAFGVRNFENLEKGLSEMCRVLKPGSPAAVIEFSTPEKFPMKQLYWFYFKKILPNIGRLVSKDPRAYTYLPESVEAFPYGENFAEIMRKCGFKSVKIYPLTFGIASIYFGIK